MLWGNTYLMIEYTDGQSDISLYVNIAVRACYIRLFFDIAILDSQNNDQSSLQIDALKGDNLAGVEQND